MAFVTIGFTRSSVTAGDAAALANKFDLQLVDIYGRANVLHSVMLCGEASL